MKIVILDGYGVNPGDMSWDGLKALGELTVYDRTQASEVYDRVKDTDIVLTNKVPITKELVNACRNIKYIGVLATGYNIVDIEACKALNIPVTNIPAYSTDSVAQLVFALLLEITHHAGHHDGQIRTLTRNLDFVFWDYPLIELSGKTLGVVGYGTIGKAVAKIARAFGLNVIANSRSGFSNDEYAEYRDINELYAEADIISYHCPLTAETQGIVNSESISKMKDGVMLINTSRGPLVVEEDLKNALNSGKVYAAGVDVYSVEPVRSDNPLLQAKNLIMTPHIGWATAEARTRLIEIAVSNVKAFLEGKLINRVT